MRPGCLQPPGGGGSFPETFSDRPDPRKPRKTKGGVAVLSMTGTRQRRAAAAVLCLGLTLGLMVAGPAADQASAATDAERGIIRLINRSRRNHGLSALRLSWKVVRAAHRH